MFTSLPVVRLSKATIVWFLAAFILIPFLASLSPSVSYAANPNFQLQGTQIIDPDGKVFVPRGVNVAGASYWLQVTPLGLGPTAKNDWKFNTVRLNMCHTASFCDYGNSSDWALLDSYINEFANLKMVVLLELHDFTCTYPNDTQLNGAVNWFKTAATRYKDSTYVTNYQYVWFNGFNEIGNESPIAARWLEVNQRLVTAIRDEAQSQNMLVFDGTKCGQDSWTAQGNVPDSDSAILTHGNSLKNFGGKTYSNIMYSLHTYSLWGTAALTEPQRDQKLANFIDRVHQAGHALMIGETGYDYSKVNQDSPIEFRYATESVFRVAPAKGIGILAWHGQPNDANNQSNFSLVNTGLNWFSEINSPTNPTNLTAFGTLMWNYSHSFVEPPANQSGTIGLLPSSYRLAQTIDSNSPNFKNKLTANAPTPSVGNSGTVQLQAWGQGGIPGNAIAILGVLTNLGCNGGGNFRFWSGSSVPQTANLNVPGANSALNLSTGFLAPLDGTGKAYLGLGSGAPTTCGFVVDVSGYVVPDGTQSLNLLPTSHRIAQTISPSDPNHRPKLAAQGTTPQTGNVSTIQISAWGQGGIPANATGIMGVLTNVGCDNGANFRFWTGATAPNAANLNVPGAFPQLNLSTNFVAPLDNEGKVYLGIGSGAAAICGFVVDIVGYLAPGGTNKVNLLTTSTRVAQTNNPSGANYKSNLTAQGLVPATGNSSTLELGAGGSNGIPSGAKGIIGVLTNVGCNGGGNFRFWTGATAPNAANLNVPGANSALNLSTGFLAPLDALGKVNLGLGSGGATTCGYVLDVGAYLS
jgi:mannan endo-1,4-beta-mannosidase